MPTTRRKFHGIRLGQLNRLIRTIESLNMWDDREADRVLADPTYVPRYFTSPSSENRTAINAIKDLAVAAKAARI